MKRLFKITGCFLIINLVFLLCLIFYPSISYASASEVEGVTVYHDKPLPAHFEVTLSRSLEIVRSAAIYKQLPAIEVCLNDGSKYPQLIRAVMGDDVFRAFEKKAVMLGSMKGPDRMEVWGREVVTSQFLAHAFIHNLQFQHHGWTDANPLGRYENWKWEGYAEYEVMGKQKALSYFSQQREAASDDFDWVTLYDGYGTIRRHVDYLMMVKYCMEEKGLSYDQLMADDTPETVLWEEIQRQFKANNVRP